MKLLAHFILALLASTVCAAAQDAASKDRNAVNSQAGLSSMAADSPVVFPETGPLPAKFPPDLQVEELVTEQDYFLFRSPCRSLAQIEQIQREMPAGSLSQVVPDWKFLSQLQKLLNQGGEINILGLGDSIINDIMRSAWIAKLQEAYPKARIRATVYVRGGGGCQHYKAENRVQKYILPLKPDLVIIGGISQRDIASIEDVIGQIRTNLPKTEFLLVTGAFGTADPRDTAALAVARHSGTGAYGAALRKLASQQRCAYLDMTTPWAEYIRSSKLHPHLFYRDVVHANEYGEQILSKIMMAFFRPR
ncbi:MAG: SGNH/GDSL hydrolase family protein [Cytophagales bacterium]|nr:SGNH/GDSL hydrolase family protein [Cytophagales bacterium]